jgi:hypothetical protein
MVPPVSEFEGGMLQYDAFREPEKSEGKQWTWCDIRPDAIIGFAPGGMHSISLPTGLPTSLFMPLSKGKVLVFLFLVLTRGTRHSATTFLQT